MTFDPNRFFGLAQELAGGADDEARLRTAVGRAYYSAFLQARQFLGVTGRSRVHGRVIGGLRSVDRAAGDQLAKLQALRAEADYDLAAQNWRSNWTVALDYATFIAGKLQDLRRPSPPS
jgi:uncharacterized protein (UPF0332 family)